MAEPNIAAAGDHTSAFWQFSLGFYARPGVADACLQLQDNFGVDVNVMLYLLFIATECRQISRDDVVRVDALVAEWHESAVLPLRALRRKLKTGVVPLPVKDTESLRSAVKRIELDAEHLEQDLLERLAPAASQGTPAASCVAAARANLAAYAGFLGDFPDSPIEILLAAFAEAHA